MSKFDKMFMRPNFNSIGTFPATGSCYTSPDICCTGSTPLADYQQVLADNYETDYKENFQPGQTNYFYVRCKNNSKKILSSNAYLYYTPTSAILWPDYWINNQIKTDKGSFGNFIPPVEAGSVGVVSRPFIWTPAPSPLTNDHYSLIARLTDEPDPNPLPAISTSIDLGNLIHNNLRYAQRNIIFIQSGEYDAVIPLNLDIPEDNKDITHEYTITLQTKNAKGWEIAMMCSHPDSNGRLIEIAPFLLDADYRTLTEAYTLEPGFHGLVTVFLKKTDSASSNSPEVSLNVGYDLHFTEERTAQNLGLIDRKWNEELMRSHLGHRWGGALNILIGSVTALL